MKHIVLTLALGVSVLIGCTKSNSSTNTPQPTLSKSSYQTYTNNPVLFTYGITGTNNWNFGDGTTGTGTPSVNHAYTKSGTFTISVNNGANNASDRIKILPGDASFQIKNSSTVDFKTASYQFFASGGKVLTTSTTLTPIKKGATTDSVYITFPITVNYIPGMFLYLNFINNYGINVGFTPSVTLIQAGHLSYEVTNSTTGSYSYIRNNAGFTGFARLSDVLDMH